MPNETYITLSALFFYFLLGLGIFIISMVVIIFLFGWSIKETLKNAKGFAAILILAIITSLTAGSMYSTYNYKIRAGSNPQVINYKLVKTNAETAVLKIKLSKQAIIYLEYTDNASGQVKTIFPTNIPSGNNVKTFIINNVGPNGGEVIISINGEKQVINGRPISIP